MKLFKFVGFFTLFLFYFLSTSEVGNGFTIPGLGNIELPSFDTNQYILTGINKALSGLGLNFFDGGIDTTFAPLEINNLQLVPMEKARYYAFFPAAAYCFNNLKDWTCEACQKLGPNVEYLFDVENGPLKAYFAVNHALQEIVLTFRGSQNIINGLKDLVMIPVVAEGNEKLLLHKGFYEMTLGLYEDVKGNLAVLINKFPGYKVIITGHSLGGAQASLTIFLFKYHQLFEGINFELYTYGSPRVGNKVFADLFNGMNIPVARVTERADFAAHFVPASLGFIHHSNEIFVYNLDGSARYCDRTVYEDPTCSDSLGPVYTIFDHLRYFDADIAACFIREEPAQMMLQFLLPLKSFVPGSVMSYLDKFSLSNYILPRIQGLAG